MTYGNGRIFIARLVSRNQLYTKPGYEDSYLLDMEKRGVDNQGRQPDVTDNEPAVPVVILPIISQIY